MRFKKYLAAAVTVIVALSSCINRDPNRQVDEGSIDGGIYTNEELGWTIEIPKGWKVTSKDRREAREEKAVEFINDATGLYFDDSEVRRLIAFQKGRACVFQSTSEPIASGDDVTWPEREVFLKNILYETYIYGGILVDTTATTVEYIDGLDFSTFMLTLSDGNGVFLKQAIYIRLINGYVFSVNMSYNNDKDRDVMLKAWRESLLKKSDI